MERRMTTFSHARGVAEVAEHWSELADTLYALPAWLTTAERPDGGPHYAVALDGADPVGALVAYTTGPDAWLFNNPLALLLTPQPELEDFLSPVEKAQVAGARSALAPLLEAHYPTLVSVLPGGYLPGLLRPREEDPAVTAGLLDELERLAEAQGLSGTAVMHVPSEDTALAEALDKRGYFSFAAVGDCVLRTPWCDFTEYLESLPGKRRHVVRRDLSIFEQAGGRLREIPLSEFGEQHARLHTEHMARYGHDFDFAASMKLIESIREQFPSTARVVEARREDTLRGFALFYSIGNAYHLKMVGVADSESDTRTYFNLCYYELLRLAVSESVEKIFFGPEAYYAKALRGCSVDLRTSYLRLTGAPGDEVVPLARLLDAALRRRIDSYPWTLPD